MPEFEPTDYLFETHADKGKERWEVSAWAMRDAMCKASGIKPCDLPLRLKRKYEWYLRELPGKSDTHPKQLYDEYMSSISQPDAVETNR